MKKDIKLLLELLEQELANDEQEIKEVQTKKEEKVVEKQPLKSNTQVCEEEGYNFIAGKDMPQAYQCGGIANVGMYLRVAPDGYVRPMAGGGGGGGYEPDFTTIALTSNNTLAVIDYIGSSEVNKLLSAKQDTLIAGENITIEGNVISATGGGTLLDYVVSLRSSGYSLDYAYYEKGIYTNASIYLASINGQSVIGKYDIDIPVVSANPTTQPQATLSKLKIDDITYSIEGGTPTDIYWSNLSYSADNKETIEDYLTANYFTQSEVNYKVNTVNTKVDNVRNDLTSHTNDTNIHTNSNEKTTWNNKLDENKVFGGENITIVKDTTNHTITINSTGGGGGGNPLYLHCVEFIYDSEWKFWVRIIDENPNQLTQAQFFAGTRKIVSLYGTTNNAPNPQSFQFMGSMGANGTIFTTGYKEGNLTALEIQSFECTDFVDWGVEEL